MRKTLILILLLSSLSVNAQDVITLRTGEQIQARVTEISSTELRFRLFNQPTGPIRVLSVSEVFAITYENGTRELFNVATETRRVQDVATPTQVATVRPDQNVRESNRTQEQTKRPQQGDWSLGFNFQTAIDNQSLFGIGTNIRFNAANAVRLEATFAYFFPRDFGGLSLSMWDLNFNTHFLVPLSDNVTFYPLTGFGVLGMTVRGDNWFGQTERMSGNTFGFNIGAGIDFNVSQTVTINIEPRYKIITARDAGGVGMFFLQAGLAFRF